MLLCIEERRIFRIYTLVILPTGPLTVVGLPYSELSKVTKDTHESVNMLAEEGKAVNRFTHYLII